MPPRESIRDVLSGPEFSWLIDRLAARLERGDPLDSGTVTLAQPDQAQRRGIDDLLGRSSTRGKTMTVELGSLCARIGQSGDDLRELVISLRGPVVDRRAARQAEAAAWEALHAEWLRRLTDQPALIDWLDDLWRGGQLKRSAGGDGPEAGRLLEAAHRILSAAPHNDVLLASLAASVTGDSHALDRGHPLAHLCLRAIDNLHGIDGTEDADARREAWSALGVVVDDLSAPALCLNLRPDSGSDCDPWIGWHLQRGEPFYLNWRQARAFVPDSGMHAVFVCENPAVVSEAARRLGAGCRPLVCLNGVPSGAVRILLRTLRESGLHLHLRADFDWAGLRILERLHQPGCTSLWRMGIDDYRACRPTRPLTGNPIRPRWGTDLAAELARTGLAAFEEELVELLMQDLDGKRAPSQD